MRVIARDAVIIPFRHRHASSQCKEAMDSNVIDLIPRLRAKATKRVHRSTGNRSRRRHMLTTDAPTSNSEATAVVPPSASIIDPIFMTHTYFTRCEDVKPHEMAGDFLLQICANFLMRRRYSNIGDRLRRAREALEMSQADLCRAIGVKANRWSQYESGERQITLPIAMKLADEFGITLDWIYRSDAAGLPLELHKKINRITRTDPVLSVVAR